MGLFITLEGIDGAGKSTQARRLCARLEAAGQTVVATREPGGAPGAEEVRRLLVEGPPGRWSPEAEILLFTAARRDHVERVISPALQRGDAVVCDRYVDSTRAYQGDGELRGIVDLLHSALIKCDPDLTLIFDLDPAAGLERTSARGNHHDEDVVEDRFEQRGVAFQSALRGRFLEIADADPDRCTVIDAAASPDQIEEQVWQRVARALGTVDGRS